MKSDFLNESHAIDTPEHVTFAYEVAGIGNRFIAALVDSLLMGVSLLLLNIAILVGMGLLSAANGGTNGGTGDLSDWVEGLLIALYALVNFALFWGYYTLFEILWNGQTPGKRLVRIRVLRTDGTPAHVSEIVIRNLVRIVDFLPVAYGFGLVTMFFNRQARRLGDFAAGTLVIKEQATVALASLQPPASLLAAPDLANSDLANSTVAAEEDPRLRFPHIRQLTVGDYELIQDVLHRAEQTDGAIFAQRLSRVIAHKLAVDPPPPSEAVAFLRDVLQAYRYRTG
jgi:uncharacterized RDD family membrane protein YckC